MREVRKTGSRTKDQNKNSMTAGKAKYDEEREEKVTKKEKAGLNRSSCMHKRRSNFF